MEVRTQHRKYWLWCILLVFLVAALVVAIMSLARNFTNTSKTTKGNSQKTSIVAPKPKSISSNVLFTGNIFWGRYINDWSMASELKYAYPFSRLNEFNRDSYDAWVSGLECPVVAGVNMTSAEMEVALQFNCSPEYLSEAAKWFTIVSLANNHTDNQGVEGFTQTQQNLAASGIQYFGHYVYQATDDACEIISLPVTVSRGNGSKIKGYLPVAFCGYHGVFGIPSSEAVAQIQKYSPYLPVIAMPHMGAEYKSAPDEIKINFYHELIDAGADMVLGDHPHWIQTTESYNGHLIVYSMGNFMFDQQDNVEVTRSAAIKVAMNVAGGADLLQEWLTLGPACRVAKDDCLDQIKSQNLSKLTVYYQFSVVGSNDADKITKPATADQQAAILDRLNWSSTIEQLQAPYSGL